MNLIARRRRACALKTKRPGLHTRAVLQAERL